IRQLAPEVEATDEAEDLAERGAGALQLSRQLELRTRRQHHLRANAAEVRGRQQKHARRLSSWWNGLLPRGCLPRRHLSGGMCATSQEMRTPASTNGMATMASSSAIIATTNTQSPAPA